MAEEAAAPKKRRKLRLPKVISRDEAREVLERASARRKDPAIATRDRLGLELMYRAGLRVSEVTTLHPRDVHRDGVINIYDAKGGDGAAYFTPELLVPHLDAWLAHRSTWDLPANAPLICNRRGRPTHTRYWQRLVEDLKAECGIRGVLTPHVFRHSYATELIEEGFPIHEVQRLLRHRHLATTSVYLNVRDEQLRRRMSRRGSWRPEDD